jgi:hypothetical protein
MVDFRTLPTHATNDAEMQMWQDWASSASPSELFQAFLCRLNRLNLLARGDLEPIPALLASKLQAHLEGGPA